jgi:hypothetical protein
VSFEQLCSYLCPQLPTLLILYHGKYLKVKVHGLKSQQETLQCCDRRSHKERRWEHIGDSTPCFPGILHWIVSWLSLFISFCREDWQWQRFEQPLNHNPSDCHAQLYSTCQKNLFLLPCESRGTRYGLEAVPFPCRVYTQCAEAEILEKQYQDFSALLLTLSHSSVSYLTHFHLYSRHLAYPHASFKCRHLQSVSTTGQIWVIRIPDVYFLVKVLVFNFGTSVFSWTPITWCWLSNE